MGVFGNLLGQGLGMLGEGIFGKTKGINGAELGGHLGETFLPFARGGVVPPPYRAYQRGGRVKKSKSGKRKSRK